ncbi:hypothetical protein [Laceyella putida]|uniref:DUF2306 domain-containing protein n=1 Tax=Laceyella putida TaxID=110101 RepID=A0ABW2RLX5_9BACL
MFEWKGKTVWILLTLAIISLTVFLVAPYLLFDPTKSRVKIDPSSGLHFPLLLVHIFSAAISLVIGPFQFSNTLRAKHRNFIECWGVSISDRSLLVG